MNHQAPVVEYHQTENCRDKNLWMNKKIHLLIKQLFKPEEFEQNNNIINENNLIEKLNE